jgi:hypothetical protein
MNRIYNVYLVRDPSEMYSGPKTQVVLCEEHWKRYKLLLKKDPTTHALKAWFGKTSRECYWCEEPESFEALENKLISKE